MKIALINTKGGVGKTTAALLLAARMRLAGYHAVVDDRDPQSTATALAENLDVPISSVGELVFIDTAPRPDYRPTVAAAEEADVVVLVASPSPADVLTTMHSAAMLQRVRPHERVTCVLLNRVLAPTRLAREVDDLLGPRLPYRVLRSRLTRREAYQHALLHGLKSVGPALRAELSDIAFEILSLHAGIKADNVK